MALCIFCSNERSRKSGEHIWDNWLNREAGKDIRRRSTVIEVGRDGAELRRYPTDSLTVTRNVVCDQCNHTWMSDLTSLAKDRLEGFIRHDRPGVLDEVAIVTVAMFAFMKSAVLEWSQEQVRKPCISRGRCLDFRRSLLPPSTTASLPNGLQIWVAHYRRQRAMEAYAYIDELSGRGPFKGYRILVITYVVGSFAFQATFPRWRNSVRLPHPVPFLVLHGDRYSVPIWPNVQTARWPPRAQLSSGTLDDFRERFRRILIPSGRGRGA